MFNVKPGLSPQNLSGEYAYYQSAFDLKKCSWNYTVVGLGFLFMEMGFMSRRRMKLITIDQRES